MFAYCNNAPVSFVDNSGTAPWPTTVVMSDATASSRRIFSDKDQAAIDFARKNYRQSRHDGVEYGAIIYSRTSAGVTAYTYGQIIMGTEGEIQTSYDVDNYLLALGWDVTGFVHTHPDYSPFSNTDINTHFSDTNVIPNFTTYVVFGPSADCFIIRRLYGNGNYLVYPILDGGSSWISSTRVNEKC